jgi:hypothetical protein
MTEKTKKQKAMLAYFGEPLTQQCLDEILQRLDWLISNCKDSNGSYLPEAKNLGKALDRITRLRHPDWKLRAGFLCPPVKSFLSKAAKGVTYDRNNQKTKGG